MDPALKTLKAALETIRDAAINALAESERPQEQHSMEWKCKECRYVKHFTRPVTFTGDGKRFVAHLHNWRGRLTAPLPPGVASLQHFGNR